MKRLLVMITMWLAVGALVPAFANTVTVGVVDIAKVLEQSPQVKMVKKNLQKTFEPRFNTIKAKQKNLQSLIAKLKKNSVTMQDKDRKMLEKKIANDQQALLNLQQSFQKDLSIARTKHMTALLTRLQKVIKWIANKGGYNLVLPKNGVVFASYHFDITKQVEKAFDHSK